MTRRLVLTGLDLVLVTAVLAPVSPSVWTLLAGPLSAFAIWTLDGVGRGRELRPPQQAMPSTGPGTAPIAAESSA